MKLTLTWLSIFVLCITAWAEESIPTVAAQMTALRTNVPPPRGDAEANGFILTDLRDKSYSMTHLSAVGRRVAIAGERDLIVLVSYLNDNDPKIRFIAAEALEHHLKAFPHGMSASDVLKVTSPGQHKMVGRFADAIARRALFGKQNAEQDKSSVRGIPCH